MKTQAEILRLVMETAKIYKFTSRDYPKLAEDDVQGLWSGNPRIEIIDRPSDYVSR